MPPASKVYGDATIVITGASSGIGAALARRLAPHGGRLALVARREQRLEVLAQELRSMGCTALPVCADVADPEQVGPAHEQIVQQLGPVDVAFLNAGLSEVMSLASFSGATARRLFEVNVFGVINWLDLLLPPMRERRGGIIAITSSLSSMRAVPGIGVYAATKAAVSSLIDGMRAEATGRGVQLSLIEPGFVKSEMTADAKMPMPFIVETDAAAALITARVAAGDNLVRFPWQHIAAMKLMEQLPNPLYDRLMRSMARGSRR